LVSNRPFIYGVRVTEKINNVGLNQPNGSEFSVNGRTFPMNGDSMVE